MIIIGDVPVGKRGFRSLHSKKGFEHYSKVCNAIHSFGCIACAQLHQSDSNFKGMLKHLPALLAKRITQEQLRRLINDETGTYISSMTAHEVQEITSSFGSAALLAQKAGFDVIQVHGDRMCGSFSSSLFNTRADEYGGSAENRTLFAAQAVACVRSALPDIPIDYKLAVRQESPSYGKAGVLTDELSVFVPVLEKAGVNSFHVTLANHSQLSDTIPPANHPYFSQEGCFLHFADEVRKLTSLPICGVGALSSPDFIEAQLASGRIDFAAMSRQLFADSFWPQKVREGRIQDINKCIRCNKGCLGGMQSHKGSSCIKDKKEVK